MKCVNKGEEPEGDVLSTYAAKHAKQPTPRKWKQFASNRKRADTVRKALQRDQKGLCAYCEIDLTEQDRAVEHFKPCVLTDQRHNWDLDWRNMLLTCRGGLDREAADGEDAYRLSLPPARESCCGKAKDGFKDVEQLLNPLKLTDVPCFPALFAFKRQTGEIVPDGDRCSQAGVPVEKAQFTIERLNLNVQRLKDNRRDVILAVEEQLVQAIEEAGEMSSEFESRIAEQVFGDGTNDWPPFFTTIRWALGEGAEQHLQSIGFAG